MALSGTLKDFGIADILQLIGQQGKSGKLKLTTKEQEVRLGFKHGAVISAESSTRKKKDLIGTMLVRAEIITEAQLEAALTTQRRTLHRLGDVLVSLKMISPERFKQMMQLQATETLYRLFSWKSGHYEFEQSDAEQESDISPLRSESILMEGFRMVDEWPVIKRVINRYDLSFEILKELPAAPEKTSFDDALDSAFDGEAPKEQAADLGEIGEGERKVFGLIAPSRDVRKLVDLSCLGEFDTCKGLLNLVKLEYLKPIAPSGKAVVIGPSSGSTDGIAGAVGRVAVSMSVLAALLLVLSRVNFDQLSIASSPSQSYADPAAQRVISKFQMSRISAAIQVYELEKGESPPRLEALVETGLLGAEDLRYPWRDAYYYRRVSPREFILLPPLR